MPSTIFKNSKRILYKISGEVLAGKGGFGHDIDLMNHIATDLKNVIDLGIQVCVVVGGGNIYRGINAELSGMDRGVGDYIGMLATVMNAVALQNILEKNNVQTRVQSAISIQQMCEPYVRRKAMHHLERGRLIIFAGGTGNPYFTTDTTAVLRAMEMNCDLVLKGTSVDGVYSADPKKNPDAKRYKSLSHGTVINKNLKVMDTSAVSMARDKNLPIVIFSLKQDMPLTKLINGETNYSIINNQEDSIA